MVYGGGLVWKQGGEKTMKTIFRMNGLFQGASSRRERGRGKEIERGRRQEKST